MAGGFLSHISTSAPSEALPAAGCSCWHTTNAHSSSRQTRVLSFGSSYLQCQWNRTHPRTSAEHHCRTHCRLIQGSPPLLHRLVPAHRSSLQSGHDSNERSSSSSSSSSQRRDSQYEASTSSESSSSASADLAVQDQDQRQRRPRGPLRRLLSFVAMTLRTVLLLPPKYGPRLPQKEARQLAVAFAMIIGSALMASAGRSTDAALASQELYYSDFLRLVNSKSVALARIDEAAGRIYFSLRPEAIPEILGAMSDSVSSAAADVAPSVFFFTRRINDPTLIPSLLAAGVKFAAIQANLRRSIGTLLMTTLALWLPLLPMFFFLWRAVQSRTGASRSKKDTSKASTPPVTFRDVAGVDTAKEELLEVVACLRDSSRYSQLNARMPPGVLLTGVPGTGKTLLAKAVAGEAGVPFFAASASEFVELFVGRGAARIRDLFAEARKHAPCVVFIDELDAIGGRRGLGLNEERDQTLNQLLTELDGFEARPGVLLLAATNRTEVLDPALLRPGRLSRRVTIPLPDEAGRAKILEVHLRSTPMLSDQDKAVACEQVARLTSGFSGAELANVVNEAALLTGRDGRKVVTIEELLRGIQRTRYGIEGGAPAFSPFKSLQRRLLDWSASALASSRQQQPRSMGSPS